MKTNSRSRYFNNIALIILLIAFVFAFATVDSNAISVSNATAKVNAEKGTKLRSKANTTDKSKVVMKLKDNTSIEIVKEVFVTETSTALKDRWYYVKVNDKKGYVRADKVDNIKYTTVYAWVKSDTKYFVGAGTSMTQKGSLNKDAVIKVYLNAKPVSSVKGSSSTWYKIKKGSAYYYLASTDIKLMTSKNIYENMSDDEFTTYLKEQGFNTSYRKALKKLHKAYPNWEFIGENMSPAWDDAVKAQRNPKQVSQIQRSGSSKWVVANKKEVSYYMDPRNFMTENSVFMFENLSYNSKYQTQSVVEKILTGTYLEKYGFKAEYFMEAGKENDISPVHLASRARQESGGADCMQINGTKYPFDEKDDTSEKKKKVVYNPFNIGANTGSEDCMKYAYEHGWTTKKKAIKESAKFLAEGYINAGQNTLYFQKFNFKDGKASHQYMANIKAPYSESISTFNSYKTLKVINKAFSFIIPIYSGMPDSTTL